MAGTATYTANFGSTPVIEATFTISDAGVSAASYVEAFVQGNDTTVDNDEDSHRWAANAWRLTCEPGAGAFDLKVYSIAGEMSGTFKIRYVFSP